MYLYLTLLIAFLSGQAWAVDKLLDYDTEIAISRDTIENVRLKLHASKHLFDTNKAATKLQENENALTAARHWSTIKECRSATREYNTFIKLSQRLEVEHALEAQKQLATCYRKMGYAGKAFKFYRLYISTYTTAQKKDEKALLGVLEHLLGVSREASILSSKEIKQLLAALSVLSYSKDNSAKVQLWSAKLAERFGFQRTASDWYEQVYNRQDIENASTKIEALYYGSLLKFKKDDKVSAKKLLKEAIALAKQSKVDASVFVTIARLYVHDQHYNMAFQYYKRVPEKDPHYADALVESVYVALKLGETDYAMKATQKFRKNFASRPEAVTLGTLRAYFALQSGDLKATAERLSEIDKKYGGLAQWIRTRFAYLDAVPQPAVEKLIAKTQGDVATAPTIGISKEIYDVLTRNENELYAARNDLRHMIYVVGRSNLETLHPSWHQKVRELRMLSIDLLGSAHRLIARELAFLKPIMDAHDRKKVEIAIKKRVELYTHKSMQRYKKGAWINWLNYERATESLNARVSKLADAKAKMAAMRFLVHKKKKDLAFVKTMTSQLASRLNSIERYAAKGRQVARKMQILTKLELAELPAFKRFFMGYANSAFEEERTMDKYRKKDKRFSHNEIKKKFKAAWKEWEYVAKLAFTTITKFEKKAKKSLEYTVQDIDNLLARYQRQILRLKNIRAEVAQILAKNIKSIVRQYELDIGEKRSRIKKWTGDLKWLSYDDAKSSQQEIQKNLKLVQLLKRLLVLINQNPNQSKIARKKLSFKVKLILKKKIEQIVKDLLKNQK